jgi:hypothetical protein
LQGLVPTTLKSVVQSAIVFGVYQKTSEFLAINR